MTSLAVFDFDRTMVIDDSDATVITRLREKQPPPEWEASNHDWTPYMSDVFEHAFSAGLSKEDILSAIASMRPTPGICGLVERLASEGWHILVLTDANSEFVGHWLKVHRLQQYITSVITNTAFWQNGRLFIKPCMDQSSCAHCPSNLCKSLALAQWCASRQYDRIIYTGDGRNDYCPATKLPASATVFPRRGFPMHDLISRSLASATPQVVARVRPWEDAYSILDEIYPGTHVTQL